ncbi:methyltransferase domain-containing protein [Nocardia sp. SYP-A9097]|uniref:class I SAM-dependent methyltransferase n=1 Tax=Nocardia sp. SYP-A9097 TaxID=2663237 RepID=UPI00129B62F0|nr:class I SAM-dependent methyltransferase [Nocardia sp. SYP-A9097]MRH88061.1 methyltransferase domain-containing protein [Nocardia sp. SYP-A9097]
MNTTEPADAEFAARAEAFGNRMLEVINDGFLTLMVSIGHQTGLFDVMSSLPPATSEDIAHAAKLNERYVREWLSALTVGRIVDYDPGARTFALPPEHAAAVTRAAGPENIAAFAQYIPLAASVEPEIVDCFRNGGGVPYSKYGRFQQLMAEESAGIHDVALIDVTIALVPGLPERLRAGMEVADVGCGSGHALNLLGREFPNSRFIGYDFSEEGIAAGRAEAEAMGVTNTRFEVRDVTNLGMSHQFDLITAFDTIHDQAHPAQVLRGIAEALKDDGTFLMVDVRASSNLEENLEHPLATGMYAISTMHCMTVSLALDGDGLGTMWGEQVATRMLHEAGFAFVDIEHVAADILNSYYIARKA